MKLFLFSLLACIAFTIANAQSSSPCHNFPDLRDEYVPNANWHNYLVRSKLCDTRQYPGITADEIYSIMLEKGRYLAPGGSISPVKSCQQQMLFFIWPIVTYTNEYELWIRNYTQPGHILHEGLIQRKIVKLNNEIWVMTTGNGNNKSQWLAVLQNFHMAMDLFWFTFVDGPLVAHINWRLLHRPKPFVWKDFSTNATELSRKLISYVNADNTNAYTYIKDALSDGSTVKYAETDLDGDGKPGLIIKVTGPNSTNFKGESPVYVFEADGNKRFSLIDDKPNRVRPAINGIFASNNHYFGLTDYTEIMQKYSRKK